MKAKIATGVAAAVAVSGLAVPVASAQTQSFGLESGTLNWPIKESFISYLNMPFANAKITTSEGATLNGNSFDFPLDAADSTVSANGNAELDFDGALRLQAHPGEDGVYAMDIFIDDLKLKVEGTNATLIGDFETTGATPGKEVTTDKGDNVVMVTFTLDQAIEPAAGATYKTADRPVTYGEGVAKAFRAYEVGEKPKDGNVDLELKIGEEIKQPATDGSGSSSTGGIIAAIVGLLAVLGAAGAAAFNIPALRAALPF